MRGLFPSRVSRGRAGWGRGPQEMLQRLLTAPHPWRHQGQPWFWEPAFVLFTAFRSRVESVPGPGPERRACSLHEAPSC